MCFKKTEKKTVNDNFFGKQVQQQFTSLDRGLLNTGLFAIQSENPMDLLPVSAVCLLHSGPENLKKSRQKKTREIK